MTVQELRNLFNDTFSVGVEGKWPETYEVDHETYANICQFTFDHHQKIRLNETMWVDVAVGSNNGIMYKGVELLLKS